MEQVWFEMPEIRRHCLAEKVWVPLRASQKLLQRGEFGHIGHQEEFYGVGTLAVPVALCGAAERLGWMDIGIRHSHAGWTDGEEYYPADQYVDYRDEVDGTYLVLDQSFNSEDQPEWHLHQDLVVTLGLKREEDVWVRPDEGYEPVARLMRSELDRPILLEIRASHLRDYLCARNMALLVSSYRSRTETAENAADISWDSLPLEETTANDRWVGGVYEIHEGGAPYGGSIFVMHAAWADQFTEGDVPRLGLPTDENIVSESWTKEDQGRKLFRIEGELWRHEWIEPGETSPIVRGDNTPAIAYFAIDAQGTRLGKNDLETSNGWLWFRPEVVPALAHRRGGGLDWYTRDTGRVRCSPDCDVHFGVNELGLVNVFAKDIALLPDWQQQLWAGHNVPPDGGVSAELLASQVKARPADTQAPEAYLTNALAFVQEAAVARFGMPLFREHDAIPGLVLHAHRFRVTAKDGLFALAKDLARMSADGIDTSALHTVVKPSKGEKWGSLKSLEKVLAASIGAYAARRLMGPLVGVYELRLGDAHLPGSEVKEALTLVGVDETAPFVIQGLQLMSSFVGTLYRIGMALEAWVDRTDSGL